MGRSSSVRSRCATAWPTWLRLRLANPARNAPPIVGSARASAMIPRPDVEHVRRPDLPGRHVFDQGRGGIHGGEHALAEQLDRRHQDQVGEAPAREQVARDARPDDVTHAHELRSHLHPDLGTLEPPQHLGGVLGPQLERRHQNLVAEGDPERLEDGLRVDPAALPGDQHLGARGPLGIGQVAVFLHDERAAERDHHQDAEHPAGDRQHGDPSNLQIVAHQQDGGDREHDPSGYRVGGRTGRLHDVVLEDRRPAERAKDGDREDGDRDRGADGEADLERQVHVRRTENEAQDRAEDQRAYGELGWRLTGGDVGLVVGHMGGECGV